jgi:hypothetical protein
MRWRARSPAPKFRRLLPRSAPRQAEPATPEQLTSYLAEQQVRWAKIVETTKISAE